MTMRNIFSRDELTDQEYQEKLANGELDSREWVDCTFFVEND